MAIERMKSCAQRRPGLDVSPGSPIEEVTVISRVACRRFMTPLSTARAQSSLRLTLCRPRPLLFVRYCLAGRVSKSNRGRRAYCGSRIGCGRVAWGETRSISLSSDRLTNFGNSNTRRRPYLARSSTLLRATSDDQRSPIPSPVAASC